MSATPTILFAVLGVMLLVPRAGCEEKAPTCSIDALTSMEALNRTTPIKKEDTITIQILEDKREALQQYVAITGEIQIPYIGLMKAEGVTCHDLAFRIKAELEKNFFKIATVLVTKTVIPKMVKCFPQPPTVVLFGKAKRTGIYDFPVDGDITVSSFLARAGGHTAKVLAPKIWIIRKTSVGNKKILVNSRAALIQKRSEYDLILRAGDVMFVE